MLSEKKTDEIYAGPEYSPVKSLTRLALDTCVYSLPGKELQRANINVRQGCRECIHGNTRGFAASAEIWIRSVSDFFGLPDLASGPMDGRNVRDSTIYGKLQYDGRHCIYALF
jgi:hypothetical protein